MCRAPIRCDFSVVGDLEPSARAEFIRDDPERDLDRLLAGSPIEQLLLGLVMAAGGGLQT
jgi:hypothetical protein